MTEIEKIEYTKGFIDKMANGINPLDNTIIPDGDLLNNVRISRCLFYVSGILGEIIANGEIGKKKSTATLPFELTAEQISMIPISDEPVGITNFVKGINGLVDLSVYKKLKPTTISDWLVDIGLLRTEIIFDKKHKRPTDKGLEMGINVETRFGQYGEYKMVTYSRVAQQFIVDNIDTVIELNNAPKKQGDSD